MKTAYGARRTICLLNVAAGASRRDAPADGRSEIGYRRRFFFDDFFFFFAAFFLAFGRAFLAAFFFFLAFGFEDFRAGRDDSSMGSEDGIGAGVGAEGNIGSMNPGPGQLLSVTSVSSSIGSSPMLVRCEGVVGGL
jgi:hypothetical protein